MATKRKAIRKKKRSGARATSLSYEARIDPYLEWAVATNFVYLGGDSAEWYPVLLELAQTAPQFCSSIEALDVQGAFRVASIYRDPPPDLEKTSFCTALVHRKVLTALASGKAVAGAPQELSELLQTIKRFKLGSPVVPSFARTGPIPSSKPSQSPGAKKRKQATASVVTPARRAIVAVIDDGLAFAHERFRDATGRTRFKYFWNQDDHTAVNPPPGFGWGRELRESEINDLLASCKHSGLVDEDELYRSAGQTIAARRAKHGTHMMDLACGMDPQDVTVTSPYLIGVQLPSWVTMETSGGRLTPPVFAALGYILSRAHNIADEENTDPLPIVVNLSYGAIAGPHDGTSLLEAAIDQLIASRPTPLRVVLPAGNHRLKQCHAHFEMPEAPRAGAHIERLQWRVQPDDRLAKFMEIWLPHSTAAQPPPQVEFRITTAAGTTSPWIGPGGRWIWPTSADVRFFAKYHNVFPPGGRPVILLAMAPTGEVTTPRTAPSGNWLVEIRNTGRTITVDAWVQRGDAPFGYPLRGRQSRFEDLRYMRFDLAGRLEDEDVAPSHIQRDGTINPLATGRRTIVVGGFRRSDFTASRYSGGGPVITAPGAAPWRDGPDVTAAADDSPALHGVLAAGTRSGSVVALDGTSVAAAQVTRLISDWLTNGQPSDGANLRAFATASDPVPASPLRAERGGAGRIERSPRVRERWKRW